MKTYCAGLAIDETNCNVLLKVEETLQPIYSELTYGINRRECLVKQFKKETDIDTNLNDWILVCETISNENKVIFFCNTNINLYDSVITSNKNFKTNNINNVLIDNEILGYKVENILKVLLTLAMSRLHHIKNSNHNHFSIVY